MSKHRRLVDRRLLGTWRSDRRLTFKHYVRPRKQTAAQLRRFKRLFGKLTVRWGRDYQYSELDGFRYRDKYETVAIDSLSVVVKSYDSVFEEVRATQIFFEDDYYWFWTPWGMREFFRRIKWPRSGGSQ